jgi:hypothetical protein
MRRTPLLSSVVWSTVSGVTLLLAGCGDDAPSFADARIADAPVADAASADGPSPDASLAVAMFPAEVTTFAAECGVAVPDTVDVSITNSGTEPLVIASATATGGFTVVTAAPITIAPGASAALTVRPPAAVIGTDIGGSTKDGVLSFVTNETGAPTRTVALASTVDGANLELRASSDIASKPLAAIAMMSSTGCPSPFEVFIHNTGNRHVQLAPPFASGFGFQGFSPSSSLPPGEYVVAPITASTLGDCEEQGEVQFAATGAVCTELPATRSTRTASVAEPRVTRCGARPPAARASVRAWC